jgi:hypothetical protein
VGEGAHRGWCREEGREDRERLWVSAWRLVKVCMIETNYVRNSQIVFRLGEVTRSKPLGQCLLNSRSVYIQEGREYGWGEGRRKYDTGRAMHEQGRGKEGKR